MTDTTTTPSTEQTLLQLLPTFLRAVSDIVSWWPSLDSVVSHVLTTAAALVAAGETGSAELSALTTQIRSMADGAGGPTVEDWNSLKARSEAAHATIQQPLTP